MGGAPIAAKKSYTKLVNPFMGTATLWEPKDLGYVRTWKERTWGAEIYPGATLPNAMVQLSPVTQFRAGAGYQYEDSVIYGFSHTNKGHWNLLHVPMLPVTGEVHPSNFRSGFSHKREAASPGYYQVHLDRYGIDAELTVTPRCGFHRYTFPKGEDKKLVVDIRRTNNTVTDYSIERVGPDAFAGSQNAEGRIFFYAKANYPVEGVRMVKDRRHEVAVVDFGESRSGRPLELQIGFSFVSIDNARLNLEREMLGKSFAQVRREANDTWEALLGKINVEGGTPAQQSMFYTCLYHSFKWPALRSDVNGDYTDARGQVVNNGFHYYTDPSFWDDYRNKLILLGLLSPEVTTDIIKSITDKGQKRGGYMPTFFHGDHASTFVAGSWLRGIRGFDLQAAYRLLLKNATVPGNGGRPYLDEYISRGWIAEKDTTNVPFWNEYKGAVTKTVEYAYDDYATALLARELGDEPNRALLMSRSANYRNLFDPSTGFWRGKIDSGEWIADFDPYYPYFQYMYREANAWQSLFFAPHDPKGMVDLYPSHRAVEAKLDSLFTEPWRGYEAHNMTGFIGNYCHGNQPDHSVPYTYYFVDRQEKAQAILNRLLNDYYGMGADGLAYAGMDDAGEMSSWYVLNALGLYTYSPADPEYIVTVPLFTKSTIALPANTLHPASRFTILRRGNGLKIRSLTADGRPVPPTSLPTPWAIPHSLLTSGATLTIATD